MGLGVRGTQLSGKHHCAGQRAGAADPQPPTPTPRHRCT